MQTTSYSSFLLNRLNFPYNVYDHLFMNPIFPIRQSPLSLFFFPSLHIYTHMYINTYLHTYVNIHHSKRILGTTTTQKEIYMEANFEKSFSLCFCQELAAEKNYTLEQSSTALYLYASYKTNQTLSGGWEVAQNVDLGGVPSVRQTLPMADQINTVSRELPTSL